MFHNHKCVIKISIVMMNFHFHIFEAIYKLQLAIKSSKINNSRCLCNNRVVTGAVSVVRMTPGGRGNSQVTNQKVFFSLSLLQISNF